MKWIEKWLTGRAQRVEEDLRGDLINVYKYLKGGGRQMDEARLFSVVCSEIPSVCGVDRPAPGRCHGKEWCAHSCLKQLLVEVSPQLLAGICAYRITSAVSLRGRQKVPG